MTIADKLLLLNSTKTAIAQAIESKGVTVGNIPFADYPGKIAEISGGGEGWVRPTDWLPLPEVLATEQKFVGLYAVDDDDSNYVAILAEGAYTVDWGDGTVENFASGVMAEHKYTYASLPAGSLSSRGYKQAIVTLTPQAGQNITKLDLNQRPVGFGAVQRTLQWLDVTISVPNATSLTVAGNSFNARLSVMEQCTVLSIGAVTNMSYMFRDCYSLQSIPLFNTTSVTNMSGMFSTCQSLARSQITGTAVSISYQDCNLSASALNEVFTNLATVTGQTITITGNPGAATCDRTIATAKGWTVTG